MLRLTRREHLERVADFASVWQEAAASVNATVLDPSQVLCPLNECVYRRGPVALYIDNGHFGADLAESLRPLLLETLENNQIQDVRRSPPAIDAAISCSEILIRARSGISVLSGCELPAPERKRDATCSSF